MKAHIKFPGMKQYREHAFTLIAENDKIIIGKFYHMHYQTRGNNRTTFAIVKKEWIK